MQHCNDFFSAGTGAWSAISCVKSLRRIAIEDLHCRLEPDALKDLASLTQVSPSCFGKSLLGPRKCQGLSALSVVKPSACQQLDVLKQLASLMSAHLPNFNIFGLWFASAFRQNNSNSNRNTVK